MKNLFRNNPRNIVPFVIIAVIGCFICFDSSIENIKDKVFLGGIIVGSSLYLYSILSLKSAAEIGNKTNWIGILLFLLYCIFIAIWSSVVNTLNI